MSMLDDGYQSPSGGSRMRPHGNLMFLRVAVLLLFGVLAIRLGYMQVVRGADYAQRSKENHLRQENILPTRGLMLDRNGNQLVQNVGVYTAEIVPELLPDSRDERHAIYQRLESILNVPALEIQTHVEDAEKANQAYLPIKVKERLSSDEALVLDEATTDMPGVKLDVTPGRDYTAGEAFSHILGTIGPQNQENRAKYAALGYQLNEPIGLTGLESIYEKDLRGQAGYTATEQDAQGRPINILKTKDPVPGNSLKLNIDQGLQDYIYELLTDSMDDPTWHAQTAAAVVMSPKTGDVYSIVSVPGFDPAIAADPEGHAAEWNKLANDQVRTPLLDHALTPAAPGSTFKLVTASAALETGNVTPQTSIDVMSRVLEIKGVNGVIYPLYDWRVQGPGINLYKGIAYSSNIYFYMASCGLYGYGKPGLGKDDETSAVILGQWARNYGFGQATGIDLDGEFDGQIPSPEWKKRTHSGPGFNPEDSQWYYSDTCFMGIGQGDVTATPIQVARMTAAIASGGKLFTPHVVNSVISPDGKTVRTIQPEFKQVPVSQDHLAEIREGMHQSVNLDNGTGHRAYTPGIDIAGKTGTAEFVKDGVTLQHAWFTGFAPFDDPQVVVTVYFDLGVGGDKAAPVASKIIDYFMKNVQP